MTHGLKSFAGSVVLFLIGGIITAGGMWFMDHRAGETLHRMLFTAAGLMLFFSARDLIKGAINMFGEAFKE